LAAVSLLLVAPQAAAIPSPEETLTADSGDFGLGLSLGDPMGGSAKHFFGPHHALQWHLAWLPLHHGSGGLSMDYLWHPATIASSRELDLVPYLGGGVGFGLWERGGGKDKEEDDGGARFGLMLRTLLGLAIHWQTVSLDTALEGGWTPYILETNPAKFSPGHGDISLKIRYYF